jgi:Uma2 family endonuclease
MTTPTQAQVLSLDEFVQRYGEQGPFEYIDGEMIPVAPQVSGSGYVGGEFYLLVATHVHQHQLGMIFNETPFVLTMDTSRWVTGSRVPDVMYYSVERFTRFVQAYPDWQAIPIVGAPDFVAEVVSPTDSFTEVSRKVIRYLNDGVKMVWLLDWQEKSIQVRVPDSNQIATFSGDTIVSAHPVIPHFEVKLPQLFDLPPYLSAT